MQEKKSKPVTYSYGRGGAGCARVGKASSTGSHDSKKRVVDPDIRPMPKMLELETARNRLTTGGRGGKNVYYHCLEPGVFQRVLEHETARIVARKAEEQANKEYKQEMKKRSKSTSPGDFHTSTSSLSPSRLGSRLRSASTSTFATTISGSSGGPPSTNLCSAIPYRSNSSWSASCPADSRATTPTPTNTVAPSTASSKSIASRFFSPLKQQFFGRKSGYEGVNVSSVSLSGDGDSASMSKLGVAGGSLFATTSVDPTRTTAVGSTSTTFSCNENNFGGGSASTYGPSEMRSLGTSPYQYPLQGAPRPRPVHGEQAYSTSNARRYQNWIGDAELARYDEANLMFPRERTLRPSAHTRLHIADTQTEISHRNMYGAQGSKAGALVQGQPIDIGSEEGKEGQVFTCYHLPLRSNIGYHQPGRTSRDGPNAHRRYAATYI